MCSFLCSVAAPRTELGNVCVYVHAHTYISSIHTDIYCISQGSQRNRTLAPSKCLALEKGLAQSCCLSNSTHGAEMSKAQLPSSSGRQGEGSVLLHHGSLQRYEEKIKHMDKTSRFKYKPRAHAYNSPGNFC